MTVYYIMNAIDYYFRSINDTRLVYRETILPKLSYIVIQSGITEMY